MANLVLASKRELKGGMFWHVYRSENNNKSEEFYFPTPSRRYVTPSFCAHVMAPSFPRESMANSWLT